MVTYIMKHTVQGGYNSIEFKSYKIYNYSNIVLVT